MKKLYLLLLFVSMSFISAFSANNIVEIDGVFYILRNDYYLYTYNANGENVYSGMVRYAATVTHDPNLDVTKPGSVDTYQGDVVVPESVSFNGVDYSVIGVEGYAFANCRALESIQLPSSIRTINSCAFRYCTSLTSISIANIDYLNSSNVFDNCVSLTSVTLPKSLNYLTSNVFSGSSITSITIDSDSQNFTSIEGVVYNKDVTKIAAFPPKKGGIYHIPSTVSSIGSNSFPKGVILEELVIPLNVSIISSNAFSDTPQIDKITIEDGESTLTIGSGNDNYTFINDEYGNRQEMRPMFRNAEEVYWGRNLKCSDTYSPPFAGSNISKVTFGPDVTQIPQYSFYCCYKLNTVDVGGGLAQWCKFDFSGPSTYPFISANMYPDTKRTLSFNGNELNDAVHIPDDVTTISSYCFNYGFSDVNELTLPAGVTEIADGAFKGLTSLKAIHLDSNNTDFKVIDNVLYNSDVTKILCFPQMIEGEYHMPSTITNIGDYQFYNCQNLTNVVLSDQLSAISNYAFSGCAKLASITIPASVETIGNYAFQDCKAMTNVTIDIQSKLKEIKPYTFYNCSKLSSINIPASVEEIKDYAFWGCVNIDNVKFEDGDNVLTIGKGETYYTSIMEGNVYHSIAPLFSGRKIKNVYIGRNLKYNDIYCSPISCSVLKEIEIGEKVTYISKYTFYSCNNVSEINIKGGFSQWFNFDFSEAYTSPFSSTNVDVSKRNVTFDGATLTNKIVIPDGVTRIPEHVFQFNCPEINSISIPKSVEQVDAIAFKGLSSLEKIELASDNNHLKLIDNVLYDKDVTAILCYPKLKEGEFIIPSTIKTVDNYQFYNCINLSSIVIPPSVEELNNNAFDGCSSLKYVNIVDGETPLSMGKGTVLHTYDGGSYTSDMGLFGSSPLNRLYIGRNIEIKDPTFKYENTENYRYGIWGTGNLKSVEIGDKVNKMPGGMFYNCNKIKEVNYNGNIADWCGISFVDKYSTPFTNSSAILYLQGSPLHSQITIPEGVEKINSYCFYGQRGVSCISLPSTVNYLEPFSLNSSYVNEVYINSSDVVNLKDTICFNSNTNIYVADNLLANYRQATEWSKIATKIYPMCYLNVTVDLVAMSSSPALLSALNSLEQQDEEYKISNLTNLKIKGSMNGFDIMMIRNKMPNLRTLDLQEATILDNDGGYEYYQGYHTIENTISPYSFYNLNNLRKVILPQNITSIGDYAFNNCRNLSEVLYIPESCTSIGYYAFANSGLTKIEINKGVKTIYNNAFSNCSNLRDVTLVKGLESIEWGAFQNCNNLKKLVFPTTLRTIGGYAFGYCNSLEEIDFAEGLTNIGHEAFSGCNNLKELHLPTSLNRIEYSAFRYCSGLSEVHVPSMLQEIGDYAFTGCGLKSVYAYTVSPIQINQNTFDYKGVDLYAPDNSFYAYYLNTQWSQFQNVKEFEALYTNWYTARNTDIEIDLKKPIKNLDDNNPADGIMEPGSGLIFVGNGEQLVKNLIMNWNHGTEYPSLIEDGNLSVEELKFIMNVYPGRWYFFSFPFDVKLKDIKHNGKWVWRYYDGAARAENGSGGWKNVVGDVLKAGVGYIFQCNTSGDLELPVEKPNFRPNVITEGDSPSDKSVELASHEATNPQDASWNFIGNPNLSYYSLEDMKEDFTSPVTVWDAEMQTYTAVVPGDDDYDFHPFQAFFVQKPSNSDKMEFKAENRVTYNQAQKHNASRAMTRGTRGVDENHMIINVEISNGQMSDKTRIVFDNAKSADYEAESDASKFMSLAEVPQIYTLDSRDVKYSVNARPDDNKEIRLGVKVPTEGSYTIKAPRMDFNIALKDNETGTIHNFSDGDYTFLADAGVYENRFSICKSSFNTTNISETGIDGLDITNVDGGISVNGIADKPVTIYNVSGIRKATLTTSGVVTLANGTYIVNMGDKSTKVLVK